MAKVRLAAAVSLALAFGAGAAGPPPAAGSATAAPAGGVERPQGSSPGRTGPTVTLAWLPRRTTPRELAGAGMGVGLMSAGLGAVPAEQTYLDITQGSRVFDSLYGESLPAAPVAIERPIRGGPLAERARSAPAEIVPGLLARTLGEAGKGGALRVRTATVAELRRLVGAQRGRDLLIAIGRPPPRRNRALAIGAAGRGFGGNLTSASTRMDGYVLATDVAPTVLARLGVPVPPQMSGQPIEARGAVDAAAVERLGDRLAVVSERRGPVIGLSLLAWLLAVALAAAAGRAQLARPVVRVLALAVVYLPLALLGAAALEPGLRAEALLIALGAPVLAAVTAAALGGYRALGAAAALTTLACAVDVIAGSPLTSLSLLGPNPGLGVRFYGIGNELEALLAVVGLAGCGALLSGFLPRLGRRGIAMAFLATGVLCALVFGAGAFGADVGAAIVFPVGAAVAAAALLGGRLRAALAILALPLAILALLAAVDLLSGADAHLTRSVLHAGGLGELADVAERRLRLSAHSLARPVLGAFLPVVAALALLAWWRRDRIGAWLDGVPAMRAGLLGALAATVVGAVANDSGALLLEVGTAYLAVFLAYAWSVWGEPARSRRRQL